MDSVLGGGVLLAVAAALWLVYLVPNWLRRSEYLATERNAVRLQQTIRVLAETAETPEAVRLENAAKARALEAELRKRSRPVAVGTPVVLEDPADPRLAAAARIRRVRIATTVVIGIAAVALLSQIVVALVAGIAAASGLLVIVAGGFVGAGLWLQRRLARAQRARRATEAPAARPAAPRAFAAPLPLADEVEENPRAWTPQPLPQPLHQVRREAAIRAAVEAERAAAAREAEERRVAARAGRRPAAVPASGGSRSEQSSSGRLSARTSSGSPSERSESKGAPSAARTSGRFAAMGVLADLEVAIPDIDGALARRRAS